MSLHGVYVIPVVGLMKDQLWLWHSVQPSKTVYAVSATLLQGAPVDLQQKGGIIYFHYISTHELLGDRAH